MTERPILFSGPMIKAILAGQKTVTRRALRRQPEAPRCIYDCDGADTVVTPHVREAATTTVTQFSWAMTRLHNTPAALDDFSFDQHPCPFGKAGDRLWCRETWAYKDGDEYIYQKEPGAVSYRATWMDDQAWQFPDLAPFSDYVPGGKWRPSIFMPRWASRITLAVTSVRVERLHDITPDEVLREGVRLTADMGGTVMTRMSGKHPPTSFIPRGGAMTVDALLVAEFASLWSTINGRESWTANPWVFRIEFERVTT